MLFFELSPHCARIWHLDHELVKEWRGKSLATASSLQQQISCVMALPSIAFGQLAQTLFAHQAQKHCGRECTETMVRANVRGRALAPNVLLACGQGENKSPPSLVIDRLAHQAPRHVPQEPLAAGEQSQSWTTIAHRNPQALSFGYGDVHTKGPGRFEESERDGLSCCCHYSGVGLAHHCIHTGDSFDHATEV